MEDLIAIQSKSVAELRQIAKVLGITGEKLTKKELIARIASIGSAEEERLRSVFQALYDDFSAQREARPRYPRSSNA